MNKQKNQHIQLETHSKSRYYDLRVNLGYSHEEATEFIADLECDAMETDMENRLQAHLEAQE